MEGEEVVGLGVGEYGTWSTAREVERKRCDSCWREDLGGICV